ncbi:MAG: MFS transporter, partial [Chloroflexota bacterium]
RGRVNSVYMLTFGLSPLGTLPAGAIAQAHGVQVALFLGGALALLFAAAMLLFSPSARYSH